MMGGGQRRGHTFSGQPLEKSLRVVSKWVEALHGKSGLDAALEYLVGLTGADSGLIARAAKEGSGSNIVAAFDLGAGKMFSAGTSRPLAPELFGAPFYAARSGSVWTLKEHRVAANGATAEQHFQNSGLRDVVAISLETTRDTTDFLELHFRSALAEHNLLLLVTLAQEMSLSWRGRLPGVTQRAIQMARARHAPRPETQDDEEILDPDNPYSLSRCEFRICMMIREGMLARAIADALTIREATVRSHLSAIYAKTGVAGHVELLHRLNPRDREPSSPRQNGPLLQRLPETSRRSPGMLG